MNKYETTTINCNCGGNTALVCEVDYGKALLVCNTCNDNTIIAI